MIDERYKGLLEHKERQARDNRDAVLNSVIELVTASSLDINDHLDTKSTQYNQQVKEKDERMYEKGELTEKEKLEFINKQSAKSKSIDLRSIQRWLKILRREGLLNKTGNRYSLSEKAKSDIRYFPRFFGESALARLSQLDYRIKTSEQRLLEFIKIFGSYIVYCFVEAAKPIQNESANDVDKAKLISTWIQDVFSPLEMYYYFIAAIEHKPTKGGREVRKTLKNEKRIMWSSPIHDDVRLFTWTPTGTQVRDHVRPIIWERCSDFSMWRYPRPLSELTFNEALTNRFHQTLENEYPAIYEQLSNVRSGLLRKPTEQSLSL